MPKFAVRITATVTKVYEVEAPTEEDAEELGHEIFSVNRDGCQNEKYDQFTEQVTEIL
jgi:hypothetical protein